jgi:hypothetical protein
LGSCGQSSCNASYDVGKCIHASITEGARIKIIKTLIIMIIIIMREITMTVMVMKMAFMFPFTHEISSSYALLFHELYTTFSRETHVNVTNSLIKIDFRIITRHQSALK